MGFAKQQMIEYQDKGYHALQNMFVCDKCIDEPSVQSFIRKNATHMFCSYCGKSYKRKKCVNINTLANYLSQCIRTEFGDPDDEGVPYLSKEGGYMTKTYDTYDIFEKNYLEFKNDEIKRDIVEEVFDNRLWCRIDQFGVPQNKELYYSWESFSEIVKYKTRYVFYKLPPQNKSVFSPKSYVFKILDDISKIISEFNLYKVLPIGTEIYRGRFENKKIKADYIELGPPSLEHATKSNRMSPAGIPLFYGSFFPETIEHELIYFDAKMKNKRKFLTVGKFVTLRELTVIDFSNIPSIPGLFDLSRSHQRDSLLFLKEFVQDVSKPISNNGSEPIEYVPTQILTEYFRHVMKIKGINRIDGFIYPCSKSHKLNSCTLFLQSENCTQDDITSFQTNDSNTKNLKALCLITKSVSSKRIPSNWVHDKEAFYL
jgi:hypothetical protein